MHKHHLLIVDLRMSEAKKAGRRKYESRLRTWKLNEKECAEQYQQAVSLRKDEIKKATGVNSKWNGMK